MNQSLQFGAPGQLWLLLLVPAALLLLLLGWRLRRQARSTWAGQLFGRLAPGYDPQREWLKIGLVLTAWAFVVLALARPQWGGEMVMMKRRGIDLMLAVDVSSSMLAEDMRPNRLQHAKRGISDLVNRMQGDRLGLVAFAGDAYTVCPLTLDHGTVLLLLESLGPNSVSTAGTNLAAAIARTRAAFVAGKDSHKALVLVTDGEGHEGDVLAEAKEAKKEGLVIYTIGIGSPTGEPIPERDEGGGVAGYKKDRSGHVVSTRLDEATLLSVAQETGGKYFRSTPQGLELTVVADELQKIEKKELEGRVATSYEERFQWPLGIAVLLLMTEFLLPARRRRRTGPDLAVAGLLCALLLTGGVPRQAATRNREGTQAYTEKRYGEAVDKYTEALTEAPEAGGISYNLGNALYREQHYQDAATALARAAQGQDPSLRHRSLHNLGNTFFKMGKLPEALQAYRQALAARPDDRDTKINYEKALRLAQQQEQQQQQQKQPKSGDKKDEEKNEQEQQQQQKENEQQQQQQQQEQNGGEQKEQNQPQEQKTESAADSVGVPEGELRPEEAMRILEAMRDREKELQKEKAEKARLRARRVDKDW